MILKSISSMIYKFLWGESKEINEKVMSLSRVEEGLGLRRVKDIYKGIKLPLLKGYGGYGMMIVVVCG